MKPVDREYWRSWTFPAQFVAMVGYTLAVSTAEIYYFESWFAVIYLIGAFGLFFGIEWVFAKLLDDSR